MFAVYVDREVHDPADPDLIMDSVLEGEYAEFDEALLVAVKVSRDERTITQVYDLSRKSTIVKGSPLLLEVFDNGSIE